MPETDSLPSLFGEFDPVRPEAWREHVRADLRGASPEDFLEWSSVDGVSVPAYLSPDALAEALHSDPDATIPPLAEADRVPPNAWAVCQPLQHPDPQTANDHARTAIAAEADALDVCVSAPGSDEGGVALQSPADLARLLEDIDLRETALHLGRAEASPALYTLFRQALAERDLPPEAISGSVLFDPVASVASGIAPDQAFPLADDLTQDAAALPQFRTVSIDTRIYHDAGASAVQELACALGGLAERLARSTERGHSLSALLDNLQFRLPVSTSYFVGMAKLRALRLLAPQVLESFGRKAGTTVDVAPSDLRIHAETSRRTETIYDPYVNMLRATTEAMAAVLGGCDALTIRPYDASLRSPDSFGLRIARNVHHILHHEAHLDRVADPAAGAYYVETLTDRLARRAWEQFQELEAEGGIIEALRSDALQSQIGDTRRERREAVDHREAVLVGTTHYPALDEQRRDDLEPSPARPSDEEISDDTTVALSDAASLAPIRAALQDGASASTVAVALRLDPPDITPLPRIRLAEEVESLRLRTETYAETHDGPPRVQLAPIGPPAARSARATFARNFLGVAGFAIEEPLQFESAGAAADAAADHDADLVVLCGADDEYPELAPALSAALADRNHEALLGIAGAPDDIGTDEADFFVHQESALTETLSTLQDRLGLPAAD